MAYRIAIIGTGRVGYQFRFGDLPDNHADAIQQHPDCLLVAGVNRGREKLEAFGRRFGVEASDRLVFRRIGVEASDRLVRLWRLAEASDRLVLGRPVVRQALCG